jgi:5'-nucleotidase
VTKTILITNDDGIESPGLKAAAEAVLGLGEIVVIAPTRQQTGMGRSIRGGAEEYLRQAEIGVDGTSLKAYHCDGSPALVVQHGLNALFPQKLPDLLISGVNYGENVGFDITVSGTVGAAMEGACRGIPALAVSLQTSIEHHHSYGEQDWQAAGRFLRLFARRILDRQLPPGVDLLKVDVPAQATEHTPWRVTRQARKPHFWVELDNPSPSSKVGEGRLVVENEPSRYEPGTDAHAVAVDGVVSVTPLTMDMTAAVPMDFWLPDPAGD